MADQQLRPWYIEETEQPPQSEPLNLPFGYYLEGSTDPYGSNIGGSLNFDIPLNNGSLSGGVRGNVHNYDNQMGGTLSGSNLQYNTDDYSLGGEYFDYGPFENPETILSPYGLPSTGQGFMGRGTIRYADGGDVPQQSAIDKYLRNSPLFGYRNPFAETVNFFGPALDTQSERPMRYRVLDTISAGLNLPVRAVTQGEYNFDDALNWVSGGRYRLPRIAESEQRFYENNPDLMRAVQGLGEVAPMGVKGVPEIPPTKVRLPTSEEFGRLIADESGSVPLGKGKKDLPSVNQIQQNISSPSPTKSQAELEQDLLSWWGNKHKEEAQRAKKLLKGSSASETKTAREKGKREKVDVDLYRKMQEELGQEAVLEAVRKGQHLRPDGKGGYIGAPRTVTSPQSLGQMRKKLDEKFDQGVDALTLADPNRVGTWYDRAKFNQQLSNEPYQLPRVLEQHAAYSAGVSPESELAFALKHGTSRAIGDPIVAYRKPAANRLDDAVAKAIDMKLGPKISMYKIQNDPRVPNEGLFGVNDFRAAQAFGYTTPQGKPFQGTVSPTMHPFMDAETALMTDRANAGQIGGRSDWQGPHTQEVPWITGKAQDLYKRGSTKKGRFSGDKLEGAKAALREANNTFGDYLYKHAISATHEQIPGKSTGHIPEMLESPFEERLAYSKEAPWAVRKEVTDPYERDPIYSALGLRQLPQVPSTGLFKNSAGEVEMNPMMISRPLGYYPTGGNRLDDNMLEAIKVAEMFRATNDAQEAGAANLPNTRNMSGRNALVIDTRPSGETLTGVQPTVSQLSAISKALNDTGFDATATNRGVLVFPYEPHKTPASIATKVEKQIRPIIEKEFPTATTEKGIADTVYVPGIGKIDKKGNIVPTKPFTGEATMGFLKRAAKANPSIARNLSEDEAIRKVLNKIIERDQKYASARGDIQNTRKFFRDADWNKAVEMIRGGMAPAAALAALGYSFAALADEPERAK